MQQGVSASSICRNTPTITTQIAAQWKKYKTIHIGIVLCLNIGIDPPDVIKRKPCATKQCWIDPATDSDDMGMGPPTGGSTGTKPVEVIYNALKGQYEKWQPKAKFRPALDPTTDVVQKICCGTRKSARDDRALLHYNGHGSPRPTNNGEIWVFNKNFTQYIPLPLADVNSWMGTPSVYVLDCPNAGKVITAFADIRTRTREGDENIILAACGAEEILPQNPSFPADIFTSCLTTPIKVALLYYMYRNPDLKLPQAFLLHLSNGNWSDRKTPLGELNWIFTAITDTIAWSLLPQEQFQRLFRQDLLLAALCRNFLVAVRIMNALGVSPCSYPPLPPSHTHSLWDVWDLALERIVLQVLRIHKEAVYPPLSNKTEATFQEILQREYAGSPFFIEQLSSFEGWLVFANQDSEPPLQLPILLQVLLSPSHRLRALCGLANLIDIGDWAIQLAMQVGSFPYILRLLHTQQTELKSVLLFIWAKLLAADANGLSGELMKEGKGHLYFVDLLQNTIEMQQHHLALCKGKLKKWVLRTGQQILSLVVICILCSPEIYNNKNVQAANVPNDGAPFHPSSCASTASQLSLSSSSRDINASPERCVTPVSPLRKVQNTTPPRTFSNISDSPRTPMSPTLSTLALSHSNLPMLLPSMCPRGDCVKSGVLQSCLDLLNSEDALLRKWACLCVGKLINHTMEGSELAFQLGVHDTLDKMMVVPGDVSPDVRTAAVIAFSSMWIYPMPNTSPSTTTHSPITDYGTPNGTHNHRDTLPETPTSKKCSNEDEDGKPEEGKVVASTNMKICERIMRGRSDGSPLVRKEVVQSLAQFVILLYQDKLAQYQPQAVHMVISSEEQKYRVQNYSGGGGGSTSGGSGSTSGGSGSARSTSKEEGLHKSTSALHRFTPPTIAIGSPSNPSTMPPPQSSADLEKQMTAAAAGRTSNEGNNNSNYQYPYTHIQEGSFEDILLRTIVLFGQDPAPDVYRPASVLLHWIKDNLGNEKFRDNMSEASSMAQQRLPSSGSIPHTLSPSAASPAVNTTVVTTGSLTKSKRMDAESLDADRFSLNPSTQSGFRTPPLRERLGLKLRISNSLRDDAEHPMASPLLDDRHSLQFALLDMPEEESYGNRSIPPLLQSTFFEDCVAFFKPPLLRSSDNEDCSGNFQDSKRWRQQNNARLRSEYVSVPRTEEYSKRRFEDPLGQIQCDTGLRALLFHPYTPVLVTSDGYDGIHIWTLNELRPINAFRATAHHATNVTPTSSISTQTFVSPRNSSSTPPNNADFIGNSNIVQPLLTASGNTGGGMSGKGDMKGYIQQHIANNNKESRAVVTDLAIIHPDFNSLLCCATNSGVVYLFKDWANFGKTAIAGGFRVVPASRLIGWPCTIDWNETSKTLCVAGQPCVFTVWDLNKEHYWYRFSETDSHITCLTTTKQEGGGHANVVCVGCNDGQLKLVDTRTDGKSCTSTLAHITPVLKVHTQYTNSDIITAGTGGTIKVWDVRNLTEAVITRTVDKKKGLIAFTVHDWIPICACGLQSSKLSISNFRSGEVIGSISHHSTGWLHNAAWLGTRIPVASLAFHPFKPCLAVGGADSIVALYQSG